MDLAAALKDEERTVIRAGEGFIPTSLDDKDDTVDATFAVDSKPEVLPSDRGISPDLSVEVVKPQFLKIVADVEKMVADAKAIEVKDEESCKFAVALGGAAKKIAKALEAKEKEITADANGFVKSCRSLRDMFLERLVANTKKTNTDSIEIVLKAKITAYQSRIELERRKQEEAARKAAEELQRKLDAEAAEANRKAREEAARIAEEEARKKKASEAEIEAARKAAEEEARKHEVVAPTVTAPVVPATNNVTRTETGTSAHQVKNWKCRIVNASLVPREYCEPSTKLLNDAVKLGIREIPGCIIEETQDTRFRT
jgi:hypothetical protein